MKNTVFKHHRSCARYGEIHTLSLQEGNAKKRLRILFSGLTVAVILMVMTTAPSMAAEKNVSAEVTVSTMINFTIEDRGSAGLLFGSLNPGSDDNPESAQNGSGAVRLLLGADTNVNCDINIKADDFVSGSDILSIDNTRWDTDNDVEEATVMTKSYAYIVTLSPGQGQDVWHWLSVPNKQASGVYSTSFYYQAVRAVS